MAASDLATVLGMPQLAPQPAPAPAAAAPRVAGGDPAVWTILGEAGANPQGWTAVASTIANRAHKSGRTASDIVTERGQGYEAWNDSAARSRVMQQYPVGSEAYKAAQLATRGILDGSEPPPLPYTHFYSPEAQAKLGRKPPHWEDGNGVDIAGNRFFTIGGDEPSDLGASLGLSPEELKSLTTPAAATPGGQKPAGGRSFTVGDKQVPVTEAQQRYLSTRKLDPSGIAGTQGMPFVLQPGGVLPATPGAHYVDLDGVEHIVPGGVGGFVKSFGEGFVQGIGADVMSSADKLTGGGMTTPAMEGGLPVAAMRNPEQDAQMRAGVTHDLQQQQHDYSVAHAGDQAAQGGRFVGQAVPATAAAAIVPEVGLPGAVGTKALNLASRLGGKAITNALRGVAGVSPTVGASDAPVGVQLGTGALAGVAIPAVLGGAGKAGAALSGIARDIGEPLTETGRGQIADRMIRARAAGSNIENPDLTEYIPGSRPTTAEALGNTGLAIAQRSMTNTPAFTELGRANAGARDAVVAGLKGDPARREALVAARDAGTEGMLEGAFAQARPADPTPVVQTIDEILAGRAGQRDAVRGPLEDVRAKLVNGDGTMQTDPELLWGIRQHIDDILSPLARGTAKDARAASRELLNVKDALDPVISQGAPGFGAYMRRYSTLSQPINEHDFLQSLNLTTPRGAVTEGQVGSALKTIERLQRNGGVNGAKALSPETLQMLRSLKADLARQGNNELGRGQGSDTTQKVIENALSGTPAIHPLLAAGAGLTMTHNPLFGALAGVGVLKRGVMEMQRGNITQAYADRLLNPELGLRALQEPGPVGGVRGATRNALSGIRQIARPTEIPLSALGGNFLVSRVLPSAVRPEVQ